MTTPMATALDELFSEPLAAAGRRQREALDLLAGGVDKPIVLYGAGGLGRITLRGLRSLSAPPVAFADRRATLNMAIDGIPLLAPAQAVDRFGTEAVFVVSIWNAQTDHQYHV